MRERFRICEVPLAAPIFLPSRRRLADAICCKQIFIKGDAAELLCRDGGSARGRGWSSRSRARNWSQKKFCFTINRFAGVMENLSAYAHRPIPFVLRYIRRRFAA